MQPAINKGALLAGAIATVLALSMAAPVSASTHLHPHPRNWKARRLIRKLPRKAAPRRADFAVTYDGEAAQLVESPQTGHWLNGGGIDGALTFHGNLGIASNLSVVHANNISSGIGLGKASIVFGPRFTKDTSKWVNERKFLKTSKITQSDIYVEALFGVAHGFDGLFPRSSTPSASANSSAIHLGVGADFTLWKNFGVRAWELDYIRTGLANGTSNSQNDLRLSFGMTYQMDLHPRPISETSAASRP